MKVALEEVDHYCEQHSWLNEIHIFCRRWNDKSVKEFRGAAAFTIEVRRFFFPLVFFFSSLKFANLCMI
jgi:hypothetical protein